MTNNNNSNKQDLIKDEEELKTIDDIFKEYLHSCRTITNYDFFGKVLKFIVLFREYLNTIKTDSLVYTASNNTKELPLHCNKFIFFLETNRNMFDLDFKISVQLIQNLCGFLFDCVYTDYNITLT